MENLAIDLNYVSEAARILTGRSGTAKEKFAKAGQHFWSALIFIESWPPDLAARAQTDFQTFFGARHGGTNCEAVGSGYGNGSRQGTCRERFQPCGRH